MKVVSLSALLTGIFTTKEHSWYLFLLETEANSWHAAGGNKLMKILKDTIGNQTRYLHVCNAVAQPNALLRISITFLKGV
jgi:hypothetical protein